jgi:alpha-glucosidase (family GH31 glycosyl hydrolase)
MPWGPVFVAALLLATPSPPATAVEAATVRVTRARDRLRVATDAAVAEIRLARYRLRLRRGATLLATEHRDGGVFYERQGARHHLGRVRAVTPLSDGAALGVSTDEGTEATVTLRWLTQRTLEVTVEPPMREAVTALGARWRSPASEAIYGLTERLRDSPPLAPGVVDIPRDDFMPVEVGSLDRRGETVEMYVLPSIALYAPFYQSSRGYGLAVAGTSVGQFDVAHGDPRTIEFRFETATSAESRRLRFHLFVGPEHATILDEYTALTGRPFVPPDWAFLHWRWRDELVVGNPVALDGVPVNALVTEDVTMYDMLGIPPGVYLLDRPVQEGEFGFARFAFDAVRLPNTAAMLDSLRTRGYRLLIWSSMWACGSGPDDNGTAAQALGFLAPGSTGTPECGDISGGNFILDPTNPAARDYWRDELRDFAAAHDLSGFKLDRGEEHIPSAATDIWADGRTGREVRNDYPTLQARVHHDALAAARGTDFLVVTRSGYTGTQRWAVVWGGDTPGSESFGSGPGTDLGLRSAIINQLRAAFLGYPIWGSDTGGYYEFKDREVFARWLEFSTFSGIMEIGGKGTHAPWDMPTEPRYDAELIEIYRRYTRLRHRLQPYIVAAARDAAAGLPLARPLVFFDRRDRKLRDLWDQYLFGPDLLVAPVWRSGQRARSVYLPRGRWRSFWNEDEKYRGPRVVSVPVPLDTIPVFIRGEAPAP